MPFLRDTLHLGVLPLFSGPAYGSSMLAAGADSRHHVPAVHLGSHARSTAAVPRSQREAALASRRDALGSHPRRVIPYARSGIIGGIILGLGRALGETMAVTMLIGNRHEISASLFAPGYTMASLIANEFSEATGDLHLVGADGGRLRAAARDVRRQCARTLARLADGTGALMTIAANKWTACAERAPARGRRAHASGRIQTSAHSQQPS